ncbi:MAG: methyltransferase domain-containing protein [Acidimicrobiia bacterium]
MWETVNADFTDRDADMRWCGDGIGWGLFRIPESDVGALGDVAGLDVVELGAGTAFLSAGLARAGARPVAVDLSRAQLVSARRNQTRHGVNFPLVEADAAGVPLRDGSFDLAVSEYGAAPWCEPRAWLAEAARLLRPGGRLVFLTNSVLAGMCVPAEGGVADEQLLRPQRELRVIAWPGGGIEHHPGHGDWIRELRGVGFVVDALRELYAPTHATLPAYYDIVTPEWARRWPAEDLWIAHLAGR